MSEVKGYLIECQGRELFLRDNIEWALEDNNYKVTPLIAQQTVLEGENPEQRDISFEDYREMAEELYKIHSEQLSSTKEILEDAIELLEGIADLASKKTDNLIEIRGLLELIAQDCKKFLSPSDEK